MASGSVIFSRALVLEKRCPGGIGKSPNGLRIYVQYSFHPGRLETACTIPMHVRRSVADAKYLLQYYQPPGYGVSVLLKAYEIFMTPIPYLKTVAMTGSPRNFCPMLASDNAWNLPNNGPFPKGDNTRLPLTEHTERRLLVLLIVFLICWQISLYQ